MFTTINYADLTVTFHFSNGATLNLYVNDSDSDDDEQVIESIDINPSLAATTSNPLGSVAASSLELTLSDESSDLFPNNVNSPYYGYMDKTCYITVACTKLYIESEDEPTDNVPQEQTLQTPAPLGTFYVSSWESVDSSDDVSGVRISALDLISTIGNMEVPIVALDVTQSAIAYFRNVVTALNARLPQYKQIVLENNATFGTFDNNIRYRNLKSDGKVIDLLNQFSHCLLCNIYMDTSNVLKIDSILDDPQEQPVYTMSDDTNLTSVKVENGLLVDYSGVNVNYPVDRSAITETLGQMRDVSFSDLTFNNYHFDDSVYKLAYIVISSSTDICPVPTSMLHDNTEMNLVLSAESGTTADDSYNVEMYGSKQAAGFVSTSDVTDDSVCTIENSLIQKAHVQDYLDAINEYMQNKRSGLSCTGAFDPRLKLGDVVTVTSTLLGLSSKYKVTKLNWHLDDNFGCEAELRAVTEVQGV